MADSQARQELDEAARIEAVAADWRGIINHMWKCTSKTCACILYAEEAMERMKGQIEAWE